MIGFLAVLVWGAIALFCAMEIVRYFMLGSFDAWSKLPKDMTPTEVIDSKKFTNAFCVVSLLVACFPLIPVGIYIYGITYSDYNAAHTYARDVTPYIEYDPLTDTFPPGFELYVMPEDQIQVFKETWQKRRPNEPIPSIMDRASFNKAQERKSEGDLRKLLR